ncbi:MAG: alanine--tRNA ligase [Tissierellia bacterium]|nr:alanine--tRNA ligase [Tissierellia bacterium]
MKNLGINEIRKEFLEFFGSNNHTVLKSFSLVPEGDKSLLLINAGMAPLKKYFTGEKKMANNRATSSQRCVRTQDIDRVGKTERHATFFEMLGNFSFGNYFKREAIHWAYEFLTDRMEIEKDKLWVTVYKDDDEAYNIWKDEIGIDEKRILRFDKDENFWELEVGPCGPCSEIYVDRGEKHKVDENDNMPGNDDSDRFMEVWNLVFTQFNKDQNGNYERLQHPNIDTGMGLERLAMVLQEKDNIFEIRSMQGIISIIEELSGKKYKEDKKIDESIRVIADHCKAITFLAMDGILPSNDKRGYVMRRLIRRAYRHGKLIGIKGEFLSKIIDKVIELYKVEYEELESSKDIIKEIIVKEEERFQNTIDNGLELLNSIINNLKENNESILDGHQAFKLYDTYGFPPDLTKEILSEENLDIDMETFNKDMKAQKQMARESREKSGGWSADKNIDIDGLDKTKFIGYDNLETKAKILEIYHDQEKTTSISKGQKGIVIIDQTVFYAQGGGQVADTGYIYNENSKLRVFDVQKKNDIYLHYVEVLSGNLEKSDVVLEVDRKRRLDITRNHSATHLLDQTLKDVLGDHIKQAGSLVDEDKLRFDITHFEKISKKDLDKIERIVNDKIREQLPVTKQIMSYEQSQNLGAIGLFEDKYKDKVRVVSMGDYSIELCGGCHVNNTSEILMFKIVQETSVAAGVRRIEAITGRKVYEYITQQDQKLEEISNSLNTAKDSIISKINSLNEEILEDKKRIKDLLSNANKDIFSSIEEQVKDINGVKVLATKVNNLELSSLKDFENRLKNKYDDIIIAFADVKDKKIIFTVSVSDSLTDRYNAGNIVREIAKITGGNGGGRKNFAQAGGKDLSKLDQAINHVYDMI